jgi:hypothetical protein
MRFLAKKDAGALDMRKETTNDVPQEKAKQGWLKKSPPWLQGELHKGSVVDNFDVYSQVWSPSPPLPSCTLKMTTEDDMSCKSITTDEVSEAMR